MLNEMNIWPREKKALDTNLLKYYKWKLFRQPILKILAVTQYLLIYEE